MSSDVVVGHDEEINEFGYKQQLRRTLTLFSTFGLAFSYISPVVGTYTLFGYGLANFGPAFIWGLLWVVAGQMFVVLVFCDLAVKFPIAGALYQWGYRLVGPRFGWFVGYAYGLALLLTIASIDLGVSPYLLSGFGIEFEDSTTENWANVGCAVVLLILHTLLNWLGVRITAIVTNLGLIVEVLMTLVIGCVIMFGPGPHQPISILISTEISYGAHATTAAFLPALLAQAYVFFGFESAADVSEEVVDAKSKVPRAMILSLLGAGFVTLFLEIALVIGLPDVSEAAIIGASNPGNTIPYILQAHVGTVITRVLSCLLGIAFLSCAGAVQASAARLVFSYARDDMLGRMSYYLKQVNTNTKIPTYATLFSSIIPLGAIFLTFIQISDINVFSIILTYAVIGIYCTFQLVVFARIYATIKGTVKFSQSILIPIIAQLYGVSMIINLVWPRPDFTLIVNWITFLVSVAILGVGLLLSFLFAKTQMPVSSESNENTPLVINK